MDDARHRLMDALGALPNTRDGVLRRDLLDAGTGAAMALVRGSLTSGRLEQADAYGCVARRLASAAPQGVSAAEVRRIGAAVRAAEGPGAVVRVARILA